jgi:hypothetical protein
LFNWKFPLSSQPPAAKVLAALLDKLHSASASGRRGHLALVRTMIERNQSTANSSLTPRF